MVRASLLPFVVVWWWVIDGRVSGCVVQVVATMGRAVPRPSGDGVGFAADGVAIEGEVAVGFEVACDDNKHYNRYLCGLGVGPRAVTSNSQPMSGVGRLHDSRASACRRAHK